MKPLPTLPEIIYHPPKSSSFGHTTVPRQPALGWQRTLAFLNEVTEYSLRPNIELRIQSYPKWSDPAVIAECISAAIDQFGEPHKSDGELSKSWRLGIDSVDAAVNFALMDFDRPSQEIGPTWVHLSYDFFWKKKVSLPPMQRPGERSYLGVFHGGRRLFLQPTFRFPFATPNPDFRAFLAEVQSCLPFVFRESNFKTLKPSKSGKGIIMRKLHAGWLAA